LPVTLGADLSGVVVEVGDDVEDLAPGDAIFDRFVGAYAELALADASRLARKPVQRRDRRRQHQVTFDATRTSSAM
jgi:NADPH:quinone reductase-like Zn-dependent oxidoreductase